MDKTKQNYISIGIAILGLISLFLPWLSVSAQGEKESVSAFGLIKESSDLGFGGGFLAFLIILALLIFIAIAVLAILNLLGMYQLKNESVIKKIAGGVVIFLVLVLIITLLTNEDIKEFRAYGISVNVGFGAILAGIMGILILGLSFLNIDVVSGNSNISYYSRPMQPPYQQPNQWQSPRQGPQQPYQQPSQQPYQQPGQWQVPQQPSQQPYQQPYQPQGQWQAPQQPPQQPYQRPGQWQAPQQPPQQPYQQPGQWQSPQQGPEEPNQWQAPQN